MVAALAPLVACRNARDLPDVVVIVIDTLRADRLPFYGGPKETAPFLDDLAARSLLFDNAFATSSWTAPATASIFTGLYPNQHGVVHGLVVGRQLQEDRSGYELNAIPSDIETLPSFMQDLGYQTFGATANPNVTSQLGFERGFDYFVPFDPATGKSADHLTEKVLAWKQKLRDSRPFFLYLHFADPHGPYRRHSEWIRKDSPRPRNPLDDIAAYDSEIRFTDEHIRRILEAFDFGRRQVVIVTADHGQEFLDHGHRGHGFQLYSELTRVPLLIHDPADPTLRGRVAAVVSNVDILPTLRDMLVGGAEVDSLLRTKRSVRGDRQAFSMRTMVREHDTISLESVVTGRYKLIARSDRMAPELYDLVNDPGESQDLSDDLPDVVARLSQALEALRRSTLATGSASAVRWSPSPEMIEALRTLGYVEGEKSVAPH